MSRSMVELLTREMDDAWRGFRDALEGLTEEEYHWEPAPDAVTLADIAMPEGSDDWPSMPTRPGSCGC